MNVITFFFIAVGLSLDTFAVSLTLGCKEKCLRSYNVLGFAFYFGFFQALMLFIGLLAGFTLKTFVDNYAHLVAFGLLIFIGVKMIYESRLITNVKKNYSFLVVTGLALATSIDALAVGISYSLLQFNILLPLVIVGSVTILACIAGIYLGRKAGSLLGKKLEILGGTVLIVIALKILLENIFY